MRAHANEGTPKTTPILVLKRLREQLGSCARSQGETTLALH